MTKSEQIRKTRQENKERRKALLCRVRRLKLDTSHLSGKDKQHLHNLFVEAKRLYNTQLASPDLFEYSWKSREAHVLRDGEPVTVPLTTLSSQMRQGLVERTKQNVINLSKKTKGKGRLRFKSYVNSIPLTQYGNTWRVSGKSHVKIQGLKHNLRVNGKEQLADAELANAILVRKGKDFYLHVTCYFNPTPKLVTGKSIGLDFGIKDSITTSDGDKISPRFEPSKRVKQAHKNLSRKVKGSKNRLRAKEQLQRAYDKDKNVKENAVNQIVHTLVSQNDIVAIQDENIAAWKSSRMKGWGKRVQHGIMGGVISGLKSKPETFIVPKTFPSTQLCTVCGSLTKHTPDLRVFTCAHCGSTEDRDIHAAKNILGFALESLHACGSQASNACGEGVSPPTSLEWGRPSMKQEAQCFNTG